MRTLLMALAAVLATAGIAAAQVAAPSLNPTPQLSFDLAPNPAVVPWDGPSRVGAAYGNVKFDDPVNTPALNPDAKGHSLALLAQVVGSRVGAAIHYSKLTLDVDPSAGGGSQEQTDLLAQVGAQFGQRFSLGIGLDSGKKTDSSGKNEEDTTPLAGATLRLGEVVYLGAAFGSQTAKNKAVAPTQQVKRDVTQYGIAYHWREKERGVHVEAFRAYAPAKADPAAPTISLDESRISGGTVEAVLANILLGYATSSEKAMDPAGVQKDSTQTTTISLGYVPAPGLAIVANRFSRRNFTPATGVTIGQASGLDVGVAMQF